MSSNHNGDMGRMIKMIREAKNAGADIAKFQLYNTESLIRDPKYYPTLKRGELSRGQWELAVDECNNVGIEFIASVFDEERISWCETVSMRRYKISSYDIYNYPLIRAVLQTGKDIIVSLGMVDTRGIPDIYGKGKIYYLYCVSKYPAELSDINFSSVNFKIFSGFSDHTIGIEASIMAMARGANIIEKHFTLDKILDGWDHQLSMNPEDLKTIVHYARAFEQIKR